MPQGTEDLMRTDEEIKRDVTDSLFWDTRVDSAGITIAVRSGRVVLRGAVPTFRARDAAEEDARIIRGVTEVHNAITVRYPDRDRLPEDEELRGNLRLAFDLDPDLDAEDIEISVASGWVTLKGTVPDLWQKQLADEMTARARGVLGFDNELVVVPTRTIVDQTIADDVMAALERAAVVDPNDIDLTVTQGHVILTGTVDDWATRNAVYDAARYSIGVVAVHDRLTMRSA
jgi:osmotically-inducible protein OsmY